MPDDGGCGAPPCRRRLRLGAGCVLVAIGVAACSPAVKPAVPHPSPSQLSPSAGKPSPSTALPASALGPSACVTAGQPAGGSGPWKFVAPPTLCGLPLDNSSQSQQLGQTVADETKLLVTTDNAGSVTSSTTQEYQSPKVPNFYRSINFVGLKGRFRPAAALSEAEEQGYTYASVPPGPHGGAMACADVQGGENCVWATPTTLGIYTIIDTTHELITAIGPNAARIRDALEAPS